MSVVDKVYLDAENSEYLIFIGGVYIPFGYIDDEYTQSRINQFLCGSLEADDGWATRECSGEEVANLLDISHRFNLGNSREDEKVDMIGKAVSVRSFTQDELQQVEERLVELGYVSCDDIEDLYDDSFRSGDHYGVDSDRDTVFVANVFSLCEYPDIATRDEYLALIGLTLKTGESKMDLRGKCVRVDEFTLKELEKVQERLVELGVSVCEEVCANLHDIYSDGYYGVDGCNDTMFYSDMDCYSLSDVDVEGEELTAGEFLKLIGLDLTTTPKTPQPEDCSVEPLNKLYKVVADNKLYKVVADNGKTYYFASDTALKEVIRAENIGDARADLAVIIVDTDGDMLKNMLTPTQLIETNFTIEVI